MKNTNAAAEEWRVKIADVMMMVMSCDSEGEKKKLCYIGSVQTYAFV